MDLGLKIVEFLLSRLHWAMLLCLTREQPMWGTGVSSKPGPWRC